jgi:hypothetical protein
MVRLAVALFALALLAGPFAAAAQPAGKVYRIGSLSPGAAEQESLVWGSLSRLLRETGWTEGQNLVVERRYAEGAYERLAELAAGDERIARTVHEEGMVEGPAGKRLQEFWADTTKGYFLVYLPLTHIYEHIGQADLLRGLLGHPGPF